MLRDAAHRLFGYALDEDVTITPASLLADRAEIDGLRHRAAQGLPAIVYFQNSLGGEIKLSATDRSPQFSFDSTMVEITNDPYGNLAIGKYGIFEIQTADFHGTYKSAVNKLSQALELFPDNRELWENLRIHQEWLSEGVEGPNTANIFKRTFYQMMFKFQVGAHDTSAGCIFAIPRAVWESWQRHLGRPDLVEASDGTWRLSQPGAQLGTIPRAWIYVFDTDVSETQTPNRLNLWKVIGTDAPTLSYFALEVAPDAALAAGGAVDRLRDRITSRLATYLPELRSVPARGVGRIPKAGPEQLNL